MAKTQDFRLHRENPSYAFPPPPSHAYRPVHGAKRSRHRTRFSGEKEAPPRYSRMPPGSGLSPFPRSGRISPPYGVRVSLLSLHEKSRRRCQTQRRRLGFLKCYPGRAGYFVSTILWIAW